MSFAPLIEKIVATQNPTALGLDTQLGYIPPQVVEAAVAEHGATLHAAAEAIYTFNTALLDAMEGIVPCVKLQSACYELYGWEGERVYEKTIAYAQSKGYYVIADVKRNDIGSTMEAYATAYLGETTVADRKIAAYGVNSMTVNGYLGSDGILPLLPLCDTYDRGIFALVKTSNPSSGELQDQKIGEKTVYEVMGGMCEQWGEKTRSAYGYSAVGAVVGATYPQMLTELRQKMPHTFFLVPGYGAQGGGAAGVAKGFDENGLGAIVNSSRAILCAWQKEKCDERDFAGAARREAIRMREDIVSHINLK